MIADKLNGCLAGLFAGALFLGYLGNLTLLGGAEKATTAAENRRPAAFPHWNGPKAFFTGFDCYVADRLLMRDAVLTRINRVLTNERWYTALKDAEMALFGADGWVFLGNNYDRTLEKHTEPVNGRRWEERRKWTLSNVAQYRAVADQHGAAFHILVGPDKPSVYCRKIPSSFMQKPCSKVTEWTDGLLAALRENGYSVTYPQAALLKASEAEQVYFKTDTHWNHAGAGIAYRELMADLKTPAFAGARIAHAPSTYRGDLAAISGKGDALPVVNSTAAILEMPATRIRWKPAGEAEREVGLLQATSGANPKFGAEMTNPAAATEKRVLVFCDSFMTAMSPYLNATYQHVLYVSRNRPPGDWKSLIDVFRPELVIYETVERGL